MEFPKTPVVMSSRNILVSPQILVGVIILKQSSWVYVMNIQQRFEEHLYDFIITFLNKEDQKQITNGRDIMKHLEENPDAEDNIKEQMWEALCREVKFSNVIRRIQDRLEDEESSESEEEEDRYSVEHSEEDSSEE
jgi:hypothetical protein